MSSSSFVNTSITGGVLVGRLDREKIGEYESPVIRGEIEAAAAKTAWKVVLDLSEVRMVASAGLGLFVTLNKTCKDKGGKFAICNLDETLAQVFEMTKLHRVMTIAPTTEAAVKAVS